MSLNESVSPCLLIIEHVQQSFSFFSRESPFHRGWLFSGASARFTFDVDLFVYLFPLGCAAPSLLRGLFSGSGERGCPLVAVCGLLIAMASVAERVGFRSCGALA